MHIIRKLIQKTGFDFHRYYRPTNKMEVLRSMEIRTVLDIGANIGQFATEIRKILPNAFIYSFEPLRECFQKLETSKTSDKQFKVFNYALGEKEEEVEMQKNEYAPSSSLLLLSSNHLNLFPHATKTTSEKIVVKRLDDIAPTLNLTDNILIKIDVQGFEDKVIAGGIQTFSRAEALIVETSFIELYKGQPTFNQIYKSLTDLGFSYHGGLQEKVDKHTRQIISEDSLFLKQNF